MKISALVAEIPLDRHVLVGLDNFGRRDGAIVGAAMDARADGKATLVNDRIIGVGLHHRRVRIGRSRRGVLIKLHNHILVVP